MIDWFDRVSSNLVLLEECPLKDVGTAIGAFAGRVRDHIREYDGRLDAEKGRTPDKADARSVLRSDHARFAVSLEQLDWFYAIVARDDHGGHRQALGQYGRVVTEALRRHRADEREYLGASSVQPAERSPDP